MSDKPFRVVSFNPSFDGNTFNCGTESLDSYFRNQLSQDIRRRETACFIALSKEDRIAGFYTLASSSVFLDDLPESIKKNFPVILPFPWSEWDGLPLIRLSKGKVWV